MIFEECMALGALSDSCVSQRARGELQSLFRAVCSTSCSPAIASYCADLATHDAAFRVDAIRGDNTKSPATRLRSSAATRGYPHLTSRWVWFRGLPVWSVISS